MEIKEKHLLIILALSMITKTESSMELKSYTACYGNLGLQNFLQPSCPAGEKIVVMAVYTLAKYKSTGCPQQQTDLGDDPACCQYDVTDCSYLYDSGSFRSYYQTCNGQSSCLIQVSWIEIPAHCNSSIYTERTHYMKMDYYCISDQAIDPCTDLTTSDSPTFFWNSGYPGKMTSTSTSCTCSIEMSCDTTVQLTATDLQLKDAGNCKQSFSVTDGNSYSIFDCSNNNDFLPNMIYTSNGHFMKIVFVNNFGTTGGKFLIQVQGSNPTGEVTLSCGASASIASSQSPDTLPTCPVEGDTSTNIQTIWPSTTTEDSATLIALSTDSSTVSPTISLKDSTTATAMTTVDSTTPTILSTENSTTSTTLINEESTSPTGLTTVDSTTSTTLTTEDPTSPTPLTTVYPTSPNTLTTENSTTFTTLTTEESTSPTTLTTEYPTSPTTLITGDTTTSAMLTNENPTTPSTLTAEESTSPTTLTTEYPKSPTTLTTEEFTTSTALTNDSYPTTPTPLTNGDSTTPTAMSNDSSPVLSSISPFAQTKDSTTLIHLPVTTQATDSSIVSATIFPNVQTEDSTTSTPITTESTPLSTQDATTSGFSLNMTIMSNASIESTSDVAPEHSKPPQMSTDLPTVTATEPTTNIFRIVLPAVIGGIVALSLIVVFFCYLYRRKKRARSSDFSFPLTNF